MAYAIPPDQALSPGETYTLTMQFSTDLPTWIAGPIGGALSAAGASVQSLEIAGGTVTAIFAAPVVLALPAILGGIAAVITALGIVLSGAVVLWTLVSSGALGSVAKTIKSGSDTASALAEKATKRVEDDKPILPGFDIGTPLIIGLALLAVLILVKR